MTAVLHHTSIWLPLTQTWLYNQVRFLPSDIEAHICCDRTENLDQFEVPNIHCYADQPAWKRHWHKATQALGLRCSRAPLAEIAGKCGIDVLHSHFGHEGWNNMHAARRAGLRHVVTFYGLDVNFLPRSNPVWRDRYVELFEHVDAVLCEGPHMASCVNGTLGCPPEKLKVQRLGVSIDEIPFAPLPWRTGDPLKVLIAAGFREKKGIPLALTALAHLRRTIPLEITLIGDAGAEPRAQGEKGRILDVIRRNGISNSVRLLGFQPHSRMLEEARRHHIFVSPSITAADGDTEGGAPVSLIEMSASGMLVVGSTHCDIPEIVKDGVTGLLAAEDDLDGLVNKLNWAVRHEGEWDRMRRAARQYVENEFNAKIQAQKLAGMYRALAEQGRPECPN